MYKFIVGVVIFNLPLGVKVPCFYKQRVLRRGKIPVAKRNSKRMFEKWYSVIFITLLPPFPLVKGGNNKNPVPSPLQGEG